MDVTQSVNRTVNLVGVAIASVAGFAFAPEMLIEPDMIDKVDDFLILLVGIAAIVWYLREGHRYARSLVPVVAVVAAAALKVFAIVVEIADPEDVGDDFGGLILFVLGSALAIYLYRKASQPMAEG
ncbi:MAG TPA: hypothetical protein VIL84_09300 [Devosiaceae bacterium]